MNEFSDDYNNLGSDIVNPNQYTRELSQDDREAAIAAIVTNPAVFCAVDYWAAETHGSGVKFTKGVESATSILQERSEVLANIADNLERQGGLGQWDLGRGVVGTMHRGESELYVLLARGRYTEDGDRPDITMCVEVPRTQDLSFTADSINADPSLLVDSLKLLLPDPVKQGSIRSIGEDIEISSPLIAIPQAVTSPYYRYRS